MASNVSNSIDATEENFPGGLQNDGDISFVHFSKIEAKVYDELQGGAFIDEDMLPIRSYKPFGELLKKPEFIELVSHVLGDLGPNGEHTQPELMEVQDIGMERALDNEKKWEPAPGDDLPEIKELAQKGTKPDTIMCYMPMNVIFFLGQVTDGVVHINPHTGYPEFGFGNVFKSIVRVGATIAGAVAGGPVGAMVGSVAGSAATGRRPRDWFGPAAGAGLATGALNMVGPYIPGFGNLGGSLAGSGIPGVGAVGGAMQNMATPSGNSMNLPNAFGNGPAGGAIGSGVSNLFGSGAAAPTGKSTTPGLGQNAMNMLPYALSIGSGFMAKQGQKERYEMEKKEREQFLRDREELEEKNRRRFGFYTPLQKLEASNVMSNPRFGEQGEGAYLYSGDPRYDAVKKGMAYAHGGEVVVKKNVPLRKGILIKGPGKGQSDVIHTNAPEGSYIVDASTISMLGDGSTEAGAEVLNRHLDNVINGLDAHTREICLGHDTNKKMLPCAFSRDEAYIRPSIVVALGDGHQSKGVAKLDKFVANLRAHKTSNGDQLPPAAKSIKSYMEG